jgi:NADH-quinone oxidoreductase subunit L
VIFVKPVVWLSEIDKDDFFDWLNICISRLALLMNHLLGITQNGKLRWYLMSFTIGIALILTYLIYR